MAKKVRKKNAHIKSENCDKKGRYPKKCPLPIVGGGEGETTLKVKGGDDSVSEVSEGWNPIKCPFPIVGGGEGVTTLKVKGGDDNDRKVIVGGGEGLTTLKVKGGDEGGCEKGISL